MAALTNVQVVPTYLGAGNNIAVKDATGTITHGSATTIAVALTQAPKADGVFSIYGREANNQVSYPETYYKSGDQNSATFTDDPAWAPPHAAEAE